MDSYALISVFNKENIINLAEALSQNGYKLVATDGTRAILEEKGINALPIKELTHNPNAFEDCIQAFSFATTAGIVFNRQNPSHLKQLKALGLKQIDVVVCNFPPLEEEVKTINDFNIHHVDIGGPFMVRSAAVNFKDVLVIVDPQDYPRIIDKLKSHSIDLNFRKSLAQKAFTYTYSYDKQISTFLNS